MTTVPEVLVTSSEGHKGWSEVKDSVSAGLVGAGEGDTAIDPVWGTSVWGTLEVCSGLEAGSEAVSVLDSVWDLVLDSTTSVSQGTVRVTVL